MKLVGLVLGTFFLAGLGMLAGSCFTIVRTRHFQETAVSADGVVVENIYRESHGASGHERSSAYYPHVRFRTGIGQDIDFVSNTGATPPSYTVNQEVTVLYDPQDPHHASLKSFWSLWGMSLLMGIMGAAFTAPGLGFLLWKRASDRKSTWLHQNGRRIQADIMGVELNRSLEVNQANPYRIRCQWLDPVRHEMHVFHSANIWYDPSRFLEGKKTLEVLVDPDNLRRYSVETSFLPKVV